MTKYLARRLLQAVPLLLGITMITFLVVHLAPGGPAQVMISPDASPADIARIERALGLDRPIHVQYVMWMGRMLRGDFGRSFNDGQLVTTKIAERLPNTLMLTLVSFTVALALAIPIGIVSAVRQYSALDKVSTVVALIGVSLPAFWFGLMLMLLFSVQLRWLPSHGLSTYGSGFILGDRIKHLILPVTVLAYGGNLAAYMRYTRSSMLEVIRQDYVRTARSKGVAERVVIYKHALKNALIPLITMFGLSLPGFFSGALITENLFAIPGIGRLALQSVFTRDYNVIMAINLMVATLVVVGNLLADILYAVVDPRIRYD
ncbi:MAG: ABC transporter permease [Bacillota bacterium]